jgi:hypothetical protein
MYGLPFTFNLIPTIHHPSTVVKYLNLFFPNLAKSLSPPLAKALHNYIQSISSDLTLKEVVGQACMEYLERRKGINNTFANAIQDSGTVEKNHPKEDILGFSDFLDD